MSGTTWTKFFWSDWETDPALRLCSFAAQGLWMRMLCIASAHDPIGYVAVAGRALDETSIARMTGGTESEVRDLLGELDRNGVFSRDRSGRIYSRRMVADAKRASIARKNGKKGGNPTLGNTRGNQPQDNPPDKAGLKPQEPEARVQNRIPPTPQGGKRRKPETPLPPDCPCAEIVDTMQAEARRAGANLDLSHEARQFRDWWLAKDGRNRDWDACWRTWARRAIARAPKTAVAASRERTAIAPDDRWRRWMRECARNGYWPKDDAGPRPGMPGCRVPAHILAEFGCGPTPANDGADLFERGTGAAA